MRAYAGMEKQMPRSKLLMVSVFAVAAGVALAGDDELSSGLMPLPKKAAPKPVAGKPATAVSARPALPATAVSARPAAPATRPLTREQADALLEANWLWEAGGEPTAQLVNDEIAAAYALAARLGAGAKKVDLSAELAELDKLAAAAKGAAPDAAKLYTAVRRVKRRIMFLNPAVDFQRLLLIDGSPPRGHESGHRNTYGGDLAAQGPSRILVLDGLRPDANATDVIPSGSGSVMRMDLSFDATKLLCSLRPAAERSYHLFEIPLNAEGKPAGAARQLTNSPYHDLDPIYLADGRIVFSTTRGNTYVRCLPNSPCSVLARCEADGSNIRFISNNNEPDYTPCLMPDGRILFTRWEYTERPLWRLQKLWTMNPDGTGVAHYWGNRSYHPDVTWEARPLPGTGKVMFTGVGHHDVGGGPIGIIDADEGRDLPGGLYKVTAETPWTEVGDPREGSRTYSPSYRGCPQFGRFASPYPLSSHDFLVSARGRDGKSDGYWLYLMDVDGNRELVYAGTGPGGVWCAMPLRPRAKPPIIRDRVQWPAAGEKAQDGVFYSVNIYDGVEGLPPGKARFLRVLQQDHKTYSMGFKSFRHSGPIISALQEDAVKRILGTVPIQGDGWVSFKAPAGRALYFQLLDANQRCLQTMRSFIGVMPGENRGCVGCHEGHSTAPTPVAGGGPRYQLAELTPPPWGANVSVSYERFAQPVLDRHCGKCHQAHGAPDGGDGKGRAVLDLTLRGGLPERGIDDPKLLPFKEPYLTLIGNTSWKVGNYSAKALREGAAKDAQPSPMVDPKGKGYGLAGALGVEAGGPGLGPIKPMTMLSGTSRLIDIATSGKHNKVKIEGEDLQRLIAWVDCNCVYRGDEEVRQIPDPNEATFRKAGWTVPPKTCTAPIIDRLQPINDPPPAK